MGTGQTVGRPKVCRYAAPQLTCPLLTFLPDIVTNPDQPIYVSFTSLPAVSLLSAQVLLFLLSGWFHLKQIPAPVTGSITPWKAVTFVAGLAVGKP